MVDGVSTTYRRWFAVQPTKYVAGAPGLEACVALPTASLWRYAFEGVPPSKVQLETHRQLPLCVVFSVVAFSLTTRGALKQVVGIVADRTHLHRFALATRSTTLHPAGLMNADRIFVCFSLFSAFACIFRIFRSFAEASRLHLFPPASWLSLSQFCGF